MYPSDQQSRRSRLTRIAGIVFIALTLIVVAFVIGAEFGGLFAPGPTAEVRADISSERIELTLATVERTDLLLATDAEGNVLQNPDGDPVVYRNPSEQVGKIRAVDRASLDGRQLVLRARPPDADSGASASPSTIAGWPVVDRIRID
jgi:hypothetical protein